MKFLVSCGVTLILVLVILPASLTLSRPKRKSASMSHTEWIGSVLREINTIKVGMKKNDLLKDFVPDGGLASGWTFQYRDCPYIKVDVEFEGDTIMKLSRPYLANPTLD
jgi:hypothetical protein